MPVTILEIYNWGSKLKKVVVFEHEEDLGVFRKRLSQAVQLAVTDRLGEGKVNPLCFDDIWADVADQFPDTRYQALDIQRLLGLPSEQTIITPYVQMSVEGKTEDKK